MNIRREDACDQTAIATLVTEAFRAAAHSCGYEAEVVDRLRDAGALDLSLVAAGPEGIVGHLAASPATVAGESGWVGLGPLAVLPAEQRKGIGSALMTAALDILRRRGARGVVLVGDPNYYRRFGIAAHAGLVVDHVPAEYALALSFTDAPPRGTAVFHAAFAPA